MKAVQLAKIHHYLSLLNLTAGGDEQLPLSQITTPLKTARVLAVI